MGKESVIAAETHRTDIDGLRGVAVLSVVAYHVAHRLLPGGFLGVDIFFVISGYLITGIVLREIAEGRFSLWNFYARRIRRIYPALLVMILATLAVGWFVVLPPDYANLADSARWAGFGAANFFYWMQAGYFAPAAERLPLLHTWSLGVEEQFYLVWPLLMLFGLPICDRLKLPRLLLIGIVIVASLGMAIVSLGDPDALFYSPLTRAWELGLGAAAAFLPAMKHRLAGELVAGGGLLAIGVGIALPDSIGLAGPLLTCLGATGLVLAKHQATMVSRGLSFAPVRFVGVVSYSIYLWHWPMLTLLRHYLLFGQHLTPLDYAIYASALALVSVLSWALIETPFRRWRVDPSVPLLAGTSVGCAVFLLGSALAIDGVPARFDSIVQYYQSADFVRPHDVGDGSLCFVAGSRGRVANAFTADRCLSNDPSRPDVLLIGDSHSDQFIGALRAIYPEINFSQASSSGCQVLLDDSGSDYCVALAQQLYGTYLKKYAFDAVILSDRWRDNRRMKLLSNTVAYFTAHKVRPLVLGPSPEYSEDLPSILSYGEILKIDLTKRLENNEPVKAGERRLRTMLAGQPDTYFSTYDVICPADKCAALTPAGEPMLQDFNHLSAPGALMVIQELRKRGFLAPLLTTVATASAP